MGLTPKGCAQRCESAKQLVDQVNLIAGAEPLDLSEIDFDPSKADSMVIKRKVRAHKGKYWQTPKDVAMKEEE